MAEAEDDLTALPWWGGVYKMDRAVRDESLDTAREHCERRVREAARAAGHEPVGRVRLVWEDRDPDGPQDAEPGDKVWAEVGVQVRPNAQRYAP